MISQGDWTGKVVIDMTNRFSGQHTTSVGQELAQLLSKAPIVKAFNTIGAEHCYTPVFGDQAASMFIAGDDPEAKQVVSNEVSLLNTE